MNPKKQRIAIAEACGWKEIRAEVDWLPKELTRIFTWPHPTDAEKIKYFINRKPIPEFLHDLNAMHEAEKVLTEDQQEQYLNNLYEVCNLHSMINDAWNLNCANAAQRAEAFLRTIGKWEESK